MKFIAKESSLPPPEIRIFGERELALRLGIAPRTLQEMRLRGTGPKFVRLGERRVGYDARDVDDWINSRRVGHTSQAVKA